MLYQIHSKSEGKRHFITLNITIEGLKKIRNGLRLDCINWRLQRSLLTLLVFIAKIDAS